MLLGILLILGSGIFVAKGIAPVLSQSELTSLSGTVAEAIEKKKKRSTKYEIKVVSNNSTTTEFKLTTDIVQRNLLASTVQRPVTILYQTDFLGSKQVYAMNSEGRPIINYNVATQVIKEDRLFSRNLGFGALGVGFLFLVAGFFMRSKRA